MHIVFILAAGYVAQALGTGALVNPRDSSHGFSLEVKARHDEGKRSFLDDWRVAHSRWGNGIPRAPASKSSISERGSPMEDRPLKSDSTGERNLQMSVDAKPMMNDQAYITEVEFGSPPQKLKMILDTGSSDVWVKSSDTTYREVKNGLRVPLYKPENSKSATRMNHSVWSVEYLDGSKASGIVYRDTMRLGGVKIPNVAIESAQFLSPRFELDDEISGIVGLAKKLPNNIRPRTPSFLSRLKWQLKNQVFTVDLRRNATSRFDFGYINESIATDQMTWLRSGYENPHWDVDLELTSWREAQPTWKYLKFRATIDTGTSLMFLPDILASRYWSAVPGMRIESEISGAYMFPCETMYELPDMMFKLPETEHVLRIPGPYLNYGPVETDPEYCWGGMQSAKWMDVTVLGDVMLKSLFVAFDVGMNRVGFANKKLYDVHE